MSNKIVAFGEIMLRLTPADKKTILGTDGFQAYYGGTESNVLVCLSALGNETDYVTALPDNELGDAVLRHLRGYGVGTQHILKRGDNLGMYFLEEGFGVRPTKVVYNRRNSEVTKMTVADCDFDGIFEGCSIFHITGISFALSEQAKELSFALIKEAKKRNILVSFDFNYRAKLWSIEEAKKVYQEIVKNIDIMFCSEKDLTVFLNTDMEHVSEQCPLQYLVVRDRNVLSDNEHKVDVRIRQYTDGATNEAVKTDVTFSVLERIGGGDAFAAGVLHCLNRDKEDIQKAADFGVSCFILKHTVKGDVLSMSENAVLSCANALSKDVNR